MLLSSPLIVHGLVQVTLFPQFGDDVRTKGDCSGCDWRSIRRLLPGNNSPCEIVNPNICNIMQKQDGGPNMENVVDIYYTYHNTNITGIPSG